jgi:hypothetical protein
MQEKTVAVGLNRKLELEKTQSSHKKHYINITRTPPWAKHQ